MSGRAQALHLTVEELTSGTELERAVVFGPGDSGRLWFRLQGDRLPPPLELADAMVPAFLFKGGQLTAVSLVVALMLVFFFASAGVSAAYLTVSEIFPMETRALCIAVFYAIGTGTGGAVGPLLFANLIESGKTSHVFVGFMIGAVAMILGGVAELVFGVKAERESLESIAQPLTVAEADTNPGQRGADAPAVSAA